MAAGRNACGPIKPARGHCLVQACRTAWAVLSKVSRALEGLDTARIPGSDVFWLLLLTGRIVQGLNELGACLQNHLIYRAE